MTLHIFEKSDSLGQPSDDELRVVKRVILKKIDDSSGVEYLTFMMAHSEQE